MAASKFTRRAKNAAIPARALRRIQTAGASVYQWRDSELQAFVDPKGTLSTVAARLSGVAYLLGGVASAWSAYTFGGWWAAAVVTAVLIFAASSTRHLPWWAIAVGASSAGVWPEAWPLVGAAGLLAVYTLTLRSSLVSVAGVAWFLAASASPWLANILVLVGVGALIAVGIMRAEAPFGRLTLKQLAQLPSDPPPKIPLVVKLAFGKKLRNAPGEINRKAIGGRGERSTALVLLGLPRWKGIRILHDLEVPGADRANADHVVLTPRGIFLLDTKVFRGSLRADPSDVVLVSDSEERSLAKSIRTLSWLAELIETTIGHPVQAVLVVQQPPAAGSRSSAVRHPTIPDGLHVADAAHRRIVDIVSLKHLLSHLGDGERVLTKAEMATAEVALRRLDAHDGTPAEMVKPLGFKVSRGERYAKPSGQHIRVVLPGAEQQRTFATVAPVEVAAAAPRREKPTARPPRAPESGTAPDAAWVNMLAAAPAGIDELDDPEQALIVKGASVEVFVFSQTTILSQMYVAMTGPCRGTHAEGPCLWVTNPDAWAQHQASGAEIPVQRVPLANAILHIESE